MHLFNTSSNITIGDYGIKDINEFSVYQSACIASYAMHNGYKLNLYDDNNSNHEPTDARWNKGINLLIIILIITLMY